MGIFDGLVGSLLGGAGGASPLQGVLMNMLAGNQQQEGEPGLAGLPGGLGGLGGLVSAFEQAGLGHVVQSWIADGANHSVSPEQLQGVFGDDQVQSMADQSGMEPNQFLSLLAQHLPGAVNSLTPDGRLPT
jgi:uncharacterized protein YidB (DUF937 family)